MLNLNTKDVEKMVKNMTQSDEFEIMFNNFKKDNNISISQFYDTIKFMKKMAIDNKKELKKFVSLDVIYSSESYNDSNINYRISINGLDKINNIINLVNKKNNNEIFSVILTQFINDDNIEFIRKERKFSDVIDFNEFDIRVRKSSEDPVLKIKDNKKIVDNLKNLPFSEINNIAFRFKQRISLFLIDNKKETFRIDATITQLSKNINDITTKPKTFEIELDYTKKQNDSSTKILNQINENALMIKQILNKSETIISNNEKVEILDNYKNQTYGDNNNNIKHLYSMQPISAEVNHIIDNIPNNYSATDKADGDKIALYIFNENIYFISNNLEVTKTNIKVSKELNGTIMEGEKIFIKEHQKYLVMFFDCLFDGKKDMRIEADLKVRLKSMHKILNKINNNDFYNYKDFDGKFNLKKINDYYQQEIVKTYKVINENLKSNKNKILFFPKLFIHPFGAENSEVFKYSYLIWTSCTENQDVSCPYSLDGIIYTGINQKYTNDKREQKYPIYKYKPPQNNSIDVYIKFKRNEEKGSYLEIFDDSLDSIKGAKYRVAELMVGESVGNKEIPVPFMPEAENDEAYFPLTDGQVRDIEGNIVMDNTVIELTYDNNNDLPHKYRWNILRTRWDKTESVLKYQKRYGNYKTVGEKTWKSMKEAVTIEEIKNLSEPELYLNQRNILMGRLDMKLTTSNKAQDRYYQLTTNLGKNMRQFANWIKSILIYTYCRETKINKNGKFMKKSVLDVGVGRGGDIMKYFHARVRDVVGFDPDYENIYSSFDSATSRYRDTSSKFPQFPKMTFIQGDASVPLTMKAQKNKILNYSKESEKIIDRVIGNKKFDIINSSFAIHYLFKNDNTLDNLLDNIKKHLNPGGYVLLTLFDADMVMNLLGENNSFTSYYTDDNGKKNKFFEIKKKFDGMPKNKTGNSIDVHMSWVSADSDTYIEEYLVPKEFMISSMKRIGLKLVDTDLFKNLYTMNLDYFREVIEYEENPGNKKFYKNIAEFFKESKGIDKEGKMYQFLFRYYVFQLV